MKARENIGPQVSVADDGHQLHSRDGH